MGPLHELRTKDVSILDVNVESTFSPKDALESGFVAGMTKRMQYLKLSKWFMQRSYKRDGDGLNVWDYLGSQYANVGWPKANERYVSVETAKKVMGDHHPAILYVQSYKQWVSRTFNAGNWTEKEKVIIPPKVEEKAGDVLNALVKANTEKVQSSGKVSDADIAQHNLEVIAKMKEVEKSGGIVTDSKKGTVTQYAPPVATVPPLELDALQKLRREVLGNIIISKVSDKAKRLASELLSELELV
jgi:hypothetical protein